MKTRLEIIDPATAAKYLSKNDPLNRSIRRHVVDAYAEDMRAGNFKTTHQGIAFDRAGLLIDGQHRLSAIVKSGVTVSMLVTTEADITLRDNIDGGIKRDQSFRLNVKRNQKSTAACHLWLCELEPGNDSPNYHGWTRYTDSQLRDHIEAFGDDLRSVEPLFRTRMMPVGALAALAYARSVDPARVINFGLSVRDGESLTKGEPAHTLREWLSGNAATAKGTHRATEVAIVVLVALRAHLANEKLLLMRPGISGHREITRMLRIKAKT